MKTPSILAVSLVLAGGVCNALPVDSDFYGHADWSRQASDQLANLGAWTGVSADGAIIVPGRVSFTYPDGDKGWYRVGEAFRHDGSGYWRDHYGIRFELYLPTDATLKAESYLQTAARRVYGGSEEVVDTFVSAFGLSGKGWHTVTVPLESFNLERAQPILLETIKTFALQVSFIDGNRGQVKLRNPHLVMADVIHLDSEVRSRSAKGGQDVVYDLRVSNCTSKPQVVTLARRVRGREVMQTTITPAECVLAPGESTSCEVRVTVSDRVAPGGRESQVIQALAGGRHAGQIEFITLGFLEHPYILHTRERWDDVRHKAETVDWAKAAARQHIEKADTWQVPALLRGRISSDTNCEYVFSRGEHESMFDTAVAYQLTGDVRYAEKVALFLRRLSDPGEGYPRTQQGSDGNLVKEGGFFQKVAMGYDMVYNADVMTEEDHANLAHTFRIYHKIIDQHISEGMTGNWQVSELCGALYSALAMQDMVAANRFIEGPGGFYDQLSHGVMSDGWWYECSIGYNTWVASEFTQIALAMQPWGVDYVHAAFPATYSKEYNIFSIDADQRRKMIYGKPFQKWGPVRKPYITINDMWNALPPYIDFTGVMFANNDSIEDTFQHNYYEMAYAVYGDPVYASIIKNLKKRDLIYGVAVLPEDTPALGEGSAFSDNAGQVMLRTPVEEPRERIQAVLKYGTHGGYHGHFDRAALNSLMRYGRSFYNPEHIWYSYPNFMYAFFVQSSLPHNMVVVDMKQQEAVESRKLLFSTGDLMQATAVETRARWSPPPYGGLKYSWFTGETFQDKCWDEGRYMPRPEPEPAYGSIGEWSDRVTQRRLMAMTDDYVVLADYLDAPEEHTFDCLFHIKGFQRLEADTGSKPVRHTDSMNPDPVLCAQLITDCDWYHTKGTTKVGFEMQFGPGADNEGTRMVGLDGVLKMDVYNAWPKERQVMLGTLPESHRVNRKVWYTVKGDGRVLAEGRFGAWVLGRDEMDVPLDGIRQLSLVTRTDANRRAKKTLFWGNPVIVTAAGKELRLADLSPAYDQIDRMPPSGTDYYGGPVKIGGRRFEHSVPANPVDADVDGTIRVDLSGLNAVRFKAQVGGDFPLGNEAARRKSLSFRTTGKSVQYLTVIEPYEGRNTVKGVDAKSPNELTVELTDGRTHVLKVEGLEEGEDLKVTVQEFKAGSLVREEIHDGSD